MIKQGICKICGKVFYYDGDKAKYRKYCDGPHIAKCDICGKEFEAARSVYNNQKKGLIATCSRKCQFVRDFIIIGKVRNCIICGEEFISHDPKTDICEKDHYAICAICGSKFITDKRNVLLGKEDGTCSEECHNELEHKNHVLGAAKAKETYKQTCLERYGVDNYSKTQEFIEKYKETCNKNYGVDYYVISDDCIRKNTRKVSKVNRKISEYLKLVGIDNELEIRLGRNSYDFHILNTNILLEFDPTIGHNSYESFMHAKGQDPDNTKQKPMPKDYHFNKSKRAESKGYRCIHMFEWDSKENIANLLDTNKEIIESACCEVKECSGEDASEFLRKYNFYGDYIDKKIIVGLYKDSELLQIVILSDPRMESDSKYEYEIVRMCTKNGYDVDRGYRKILNYIKTNYHPNSIVAYCDRSKFTGSTFYELEFVYNGNTELKYTMGWWQQHVSQFDLEKFSYHSFIDTNKEYNSDFDAMIDNKYRPVYDCGWMKFYYSSIV